jgi:ribose transport system permease protein
VTSRSLTVTGLRFVQNNGLFVAFAICLAAFSLASPRFLTVSNITVLLLAVSITAIMAVPEAMLVTAGYVDLSVGSEAVLAATIFGQAAASGWPWQAGVLLALLFAVIWGILQGYMAARLGFTPIVVTLGGYAGLRGIAELISAGNTKFGFGDAFDWWGGGKIFTVPVPVWIAIAVFAVGFVVWYLLPYGRWFMAIGSDKAVARSMGIPIRGIPFVLYILTSLSAAVGGLVLCSELDASSASIGLGWELAVLTAVLLGGVSFIGGSGSLFGVMIAVVFVGMLDNGLIIIGAGPYWHGIAIGAALIFAASLDVAARLLERVRMTESPAPGPSGGDLSATTKSASDDGQAAA